MKETAWQGRTPKAKPQWAKRAISTLTISSYPPHEPRCHTAFVDEASFVLLKSRLQGKAWKNSQADSLLSPPSVPNHIHVKHLHRIHTRSTKFCSRSVVPQFLPQKEKTEYGKSIAVLKRDSFYLQLHPLEASKKSLTKRHYSKSRSDQY